MKRGGGGFCTSVLQVCNLCMTRQTNTVRFCRVNTHPLSSPIVYFLLSLLSRFSHRTNQTYTRMGLNHSTLTNSFIHLPPFSFSLFPPLKKCQTIQQQTLTQTLPPINTPLTIFLSISHGWINVSKTGTKMVGGDFHLLMQTTKLKPMSSHFPFACLTRSLYLAKPQLSLLLILLFIRSPSLYTHN